MPLEIEPLPGGVFISMNEDFIQFQEEFKYWQEKFGLNGYEPHFSYEPLDDSFADISIDQGVMVATVRLNSELPDKDKSHKDIKRNAKHEAVHLLVGRLSEDAKYRYASQAEIHEATEELVNRLIDLIT